MKCSGGVLAQDLDGVAVREVELRGSAFGSREWVACCAPSSEDITTAATQSREVGPGFLHFDGCLGGGHTRAKLPLVVTK